MEKFESKKYPISLKPYDGQDKQGWTFESEKRVLEFLEQADRAMLLKLCDRFGVRFYGRDDKDDTNDTDDESIVFALLSDISPQKLLQAVEEYQD